MAILLFLRKNGQRTKITQTAKTLTMKYGFLKGAFCLTLGAFLSKALGALYKIPLVSLIGSEGIGRYQMVYPVYLLLLTLSSVGIPSAISRLTASGKDCLSRAFRTFFPLGVLLSLLMAALSLPLALFQGQKGLFLGYLALSPSVAFVSGISILRGYFQGKNKMLPTAISEVIESSVKVAAGLLFAYLWRNDLDKAVGGILFAVTAGEALAFLYLLSLKREKKQSSVQGKYLLRSTLPYMLSASVLPLSSFLDSFFIVGLLGEGGVSGYGILSGCALTFVSLPASLSYGIATAVIPRIASGKKEVGFAVQITSLLAVPAFLTLLLLPEFSAVVFHLPPDQEDVMIALVRMLSPVALFLPLVETLSGCLAGMGRAEGSLLGLLLGCTVKLAAELFLLPRFGLFGGAICFDLCYLVAFFFELLYIIAYKEKNYDYNHWLGHGKRRPYEAGGRSHSGSKEGAPSYRIGGIRRERKVARRGV